jgi:predicted nucleotide-binding protein (sugar kinase/HSP70/actin superfamily)
MQKLLRQVRPYEVHRGDADAVYAQCLGALVREVEQHGTVGDHARVARERLESVAVDRSQPKPLIGMVGEIFVRSNPFSNNFIVRQIEELGGEAVLPPLEEWLDYIDWERRKDLLREGQYGAYLNELVKGAVQRYDVRRLSRAFSGAIHHFYREAPTQQVMDYSSRYLPEAIRGEATLSMGRVVEYARHGFHGVVNLVPFNCLPGTIVAALLQRFSQDYPHVPVLKMVYDGNMQSSERTRIEAFMYQARQLCEASETHGRS